MPDSEDSSGRRQVCGCSDCWPVCGVWFGLSFLARGVGLVIFSWFAYSHLVVGLAFLGVGS